MNVRVCASVLAVVLMAGSVSGMFMLTTEKMPVERVVKNIEARLKDNPKDAHAWYVLGRVHAMAWAYGPELDLQPVKDGVPGFGPISSVQVERRDAKNPVKPEEAEHLRAAIDAYRKAVELNGKVAIHQLGLAWLLSEAGKSIRDLPPGFPEKDVTLSDAEKDKLAAELKKLGDEDPKVREAAMKALLDAMPRAGAFLVKQLTKDTEVDSRVERILRGYFDLQALPHYRKAFELALPEDSKKDGFGPQADDSLSLEAANAILRIIKDFPAAAARDESRTVSRAVQSLHQKGRAITPVVFSLRGATTVDELKDDRRLTRFNLAGDDVERTWRWLKPGTAILVWDPERRGEITSGRQLFGSVTWWVMFRDGYEALSTLDDDRNGVLKGAELQGIAVWVDANGNGISEPGEVRSLDSAGIVGIGVTATRGPDNVLLCHNGVQFSDGRTFRSFDWVTEPVDSARPSRH